ncbi:MAG: hypothetical protein DME38_00850 [Verrucomicrobia bacterium]|nr:MAG: hypothetical protein DME38_00850 [Verrucomicrobiota bacterium]
MPLQLNLLHEEILQHRQRQRDPLKLSLYAAIALGALLMLNYLWTGYRVLQGKSRLNSIQAEWNKIEPKVTAAQKRADELNGIIGTTNALDGYIETRFYWATFLEKVAHCVTPNIQITSLEGVIEDDKGLVTATLDGVAGGREPRSVAEDFRQMLLEQVGKEQPTVKVEFKTLEDLDTTVAVGGSNETTAHFVVTVGMEPFPKAATPAPTEHKARPKKEES